MWMSRLSEHQVIRLDLSDRKLTFETIKKKCEVYTNSIRKDRENLKEF